MRVNGGVESEILKCQFGISRLEALPKKGDDAHRSQFVTGPGGIRRDPPARRPRACPESPVCLCANGATRASLGQRPGKTGNEKPRAESPAQTAAETKRWDGLSALILTSDANLERCPRLVWMRAFGPRTRLSVHTRRSQLVTGSRQHSARSTGSAFKITICDLKDVITLPVLEAMTSNSDQPTWPRLGAAIKAVFSTLE